MSAIFTNIVRANDRVAPTAALHVEVIADFVCPFSYLGKRRFDDAMRAVHGPSDVSWYPFQLNPDMPQDGMSLEDYLTQRFGSPAGIQPVLDRLKAEGRQASIDFRFEQVTHVPNTLAAHQVMYRAETQGKDQSALAEEFMSAFFVRGENIGETDVLVELAGRHGLDATDVVRVIEDDAARQVVLTREAQVRASGISGVPGFLLNRRLLLIGAQTTDNMVNAFDHAMFGEGDEEIVSPALH
jgi:predicted DsbA family dithiol-disulfide isomerase